MKLILKEYLASLKEREELDAILPDLLSELGLNVFSKPGRGTRQDGVDVAAVGSLKGEQEKVYLFSIKSGDLTRNNWDGNIQTLRPSLNEIIDLYIPTKIPNQHKDKPVVICICIGGSIQEQVRSQVKSYIDYNNKYNLEFQEWNGDKLSELILDSFLREELLPVNFRSLLRKALALLDNPDVSFKYFKKLVAELYNSANENKKSKLTVIRQINICLWILYSWCREANNVESAYLSSEIATLYSWEICKSFLHYNNKMAKTIKRTFSSLLNLHLTICSYYLNKKIIPFTNSLHAISSAIRPSCKVDVNLKIFDVMGRIAMFGIWNYWHLFANKNITKKLYNLIEQEINKYFITIKQLINNNPLLFSPYLEEQTIEILMTVWFLSLDSTNIDFIHYWLLNLIKQVKFNFQTINMFPSILSSQQYLELVELQYIKEDSYREEITVGSILYPTIAAISVIHGFDDIYKEIQDFKNDSLGHCNFQLLFPDDTTEEHFYLNDANHGATLPLINVSQSKEELLEQIFKECDATSYLKEMSAMKFGFWPLIFMGSRHYRLPIPIHFLKWLNIKDK